MRTNRGSAARGAPRVTPASDWTRAGSPPRRAACGRHRPAAPVSSLASATATRTASSVRSGKNSCSGGSSSRMFTGSPSIASSNSVKSLRCNGNSAASASSRSAVVPARMTRSISTRRSPRNMCSVRHRPIPWAPKDLARNASSAVSAFARIARRRRPSAWVSSRSTALTSAAVSSSAPSSATVESGLDIGLHRRRHHRHCPEEDLAAGTVDADLVAFGDHRRSDPRCAGHRVDVERFRAAHAGLAHASGDHGSVRGLPTACGQDPVRGDHALEVIGVGLLADQHHLLAAFGPLPCGRRIEHRTADRRARRGRHPFGQQLAGRRPVELREHQHRQLRTGDPRQRLVHGDQILVDQLPGDPESRRGRALPDPGLQHPQLAALDGELDVAQVPVMRLQPAHHLHQLAVRRGVQLAQIIQRQRVADAGDDVFALGIGQVIAVRAGSSGRRITGESDAGATGFAEVSEHHRADVHRGPQVLGNPLAPPVQPRPIGVPRVEDRVDRHVHLLARVLRKLMTGVLAHRFLELGDEQLQVIDVEFDVSWTPPWSTSPCRERRRTPPPGCPARSCRTSAAAAGRNPRRIARHRIPRRVPSRWRR